MSSQLRYDLLMSRMLAAVLIALVVAPAAYSQATAGRSSISQPVGITTSHGSGPRIFTAPNNFGQPDPTAFGFPKCCINGKFPVSPANSPFFNRPFFPDGRHHHRNFLFGGVVFPWYPMPYYSPDIVDPVDDSMEQSYGPGPTIFDRRGSMQSGKEYERSYDARLSRLEHAMDDADAKARPAAAAPDPAPTPAADQPATVLVYRDGHSVEIKNYAIVGDVLYDLSSDHRHKIALADLDLAATQKQNDERGIDFRLPSHTAGN
jgi:hypothetical protein